MIVTLLQYSILHSERRDRQARAVYRMGLVALLVSVVAVVVLGTAQTLDMVHMREMHTVVHTLKP